ncbi:Multi antimicrobial extrusion protein [Parasponia andersonii]|uniref:Multi antimicrobial extrusion protein n=1 Tax=Parasponia andersonii TaxID=3476 RepID=A0A2P5AM54_PARAD|nr:Multi antimicrobial extrusion protein [Parasponia andersonii]
MFTNLEQSPRVNNTVNIPRSPASADTPACVEGLSKKNPTPSVLPRFDLKRSRSGPARILLPVRFSGHLSTVRPLFWTPLASKAPSRRRRSNPGVSTPVGLELGANRPTKACISIIVSLFLVALVDLAAMVFATSPRHYSGRLFTNDAEIIELTTVALPIMRLYEVGNCLQTTGCGVLRGSARPTAGANISLGSFYFVGMPVTVFLATTDWMVQVERARELIGNNDTYNGCSHDKISKKEAPPLPISSPPSSQSDE